MIIISRWCYINTHVHNTFLYKAHTHVLYCVLSSSFVYTWSPLCFDSHPTHLIYDTTLPEYHSTDIIVYVIRFITTLIDYHSWYLVVRDLSVCIDSHLTHFNSSKDINIRVIFFIFIWFIFFPNFTSSVYTLSSSLIKIHHYYLQFY